MKFDSLSSASHLSTKPAVRRDDGRRRVHAVTASSADRDLPFRPPSGMGDGPVASMDWAAQVVREVTARILQLGERARRLLRPVRGRSAHVDEEV